MKTKATESELVAELLAALKDAEEWLLEVAENEPEDYDNRALNSTLKRINDVICKAQGVGNANW